MKKGTFEVKVSLAEMLKGGVIMDVTSSKQAKIAEEISKSHRGQNFKWALRTEERNRLWKG